MSDTKILKETVYPKGRPVMIDAVLVNDQTYLVTGRLVRTASLKYEWQEDVENPVELATMLKQAPVRIDLLKFWQRIPETGAKYPYYKEWLPIAAIPISTYEDWWGKQINCKTRNMVRKSQKAGVTVAQVEFSDDFVRGVVEIYNQSPIRRGKRFRHFGKTFPTVKAELSVDLDEALFVGAYYQQELIGFIKFLVADRYAMVTLILDKIAHRDKAPMNGMVAKVVEICADRKIPYFTYTLWREGSHGKFQKSVGFEKFPVPEYFMPLTLLGRIALSLRLHRGIKGVIPEAAMVWLLGMRAKWYSWRFGSVDSKASAASFGKRAATNASHVAIH
jgi:hypothetical protein